jgi:hypothetical protein
VHKIQVVNKTSYTSTDSDFYIGRGSTLGNPYTSKDLDKTKALFQADNREDAINKYKSYLIDKIDKGNNIVCDMLNEIYLSALKGDVNLVCYCKPKKCHGDIIRDIIIAKLIKHYMKNG